MAKVTRTLVKKVLKTVGEDDKISVRILGDIFKEGEDLLKEANPGCEIGYMPFTYEMDEEEFILNAYLKSYEGSTVFPTRESCPKSAQAMKHYLKTKKEAN